MNLCHEKKAHRRKLGTKFIYKRVKKKKKKERGNNWN